MGIFTRSQENRKKMLLTKRTWIPDFSGTTPYSFILNRSFGSLGDVPKNTRRIDDIGNAKAPGLHGRWFRRGDAKFCRQVEAVDMRPPGVEIVDHEVHHKILGPLLLIVALQNEAARSAVEDRYLAVEHLLEAERFVKPLGTIEILSGHKGSYKFGAGGDAVHVFFYPLKPNEKTSAAHGEDDGDSIGVGEPRSQEAAFSRQLLAVSQREEPSPNPLPEYWERDKITRRRTIFLGR
jgi:hypothetical protein